MTVRLCQAALQNWATLEGYAVGHGVGDLLDLPLRQFTSFVYWMITKNGDDASIQKFRARLWRPPVGTIEIDKRSPWSAENESKGFAALKSQLGLGKKAR